MLEILYQDNYLVAINKPSGLLVHRSNIDRHETQFAMQMLRDQLAQFVYPVHRLDKPTSGVLLFALNSEIARLLSMQFEERTVDKSYLAIVRGYAPETITVDHPLRNKPDKMSNKQDHANKPAKAATTFFKRLATTEIPYHVDRYPQSRYSLVEAKPLTGRTHQIRRHLKHIGHPIIGDAKHGKGVHNRFFQGQFNCNRLLLSCTQLKLNHPISGDVIKFNAGLDESFTQVIDHLGWKEKLEKS